MRIMPISENSTISWTDVLRISDFLINGNDDALDDNETDFARQNFATFEYKLFRRQERTFSEIQNDVTLEAEDQIHQKLGHSSAASVQRESGESERRYWHPSLILIAQELLRRCSNCSLRLPQSTIGHTIEPLPPTTPFARLRLDLTGPLTIANDRRYLLNAVHYATSWAYSLSTKSATAHVISLLATICNFHGPPNEIFTDNGSHFVSAEVTAHLQAYGISHRKSTPYHLSRMVGVNA